MAGLWRNNPGTPGGKYLVTRRDGTIPEWAHFVIGERDPAGPAGLRGYAGDSLTAIATGPLAGDDRKPLKRFKLLR